MGGIVIVNDKFWTNFSIRQTKISRDSKERIELRKMILEVGGWSDGMSEEER